MRDLFELFDAVDLTLSRAGPFIDDSRLAPLLSRAASLRSRRHYVGDVLVLAIAGGTGTGKSSVLNAIAGEQVASVSVRRPHTDQPLAWIPSTADDAFRDALAKIGVTRQVEQSVLPQLAIVDLPDMDSIASWHRQMVEDLLPRIDAVLWLFEPEKYRDRIVHEEFLSELSSYRHQFFFALNQIDRVRPGDRTAVLEDLGRALLEDGFDDPLVFAIAAAPTRGPVLGIAELRDFLATRLDVKRTAITKSIIDARSLVRAIGEAAGVWNAAPLDFERRWEAARRQARGDLETAIGPAAREEAMCRVEDLVAALSTEAGDAFGAVLRERFDQKRIEAAIDEAIDRLDASEGDQSLDEFGADLRAVLWDRSRLAATTVYAAVGADQLADRVGQLARRSWAGTRTLSASGS